MRYEEATPTDRAELTTALEGGDPDAIAIALVGVVHSDPDSEWLQGVCLELTGHDAPGVRAVAITCLGHIARLHRHIDRALVVPRLRELEAETELSGYAEDALADVEMFAADD